MSYKIYHCESKQLYTVRIVLIFHEVLLQTDFGFWMNIHVWILKLSIRNKIQKCLIENY